MQPPLGCRAGAGSYVASMFFDGWQDVVRVLAKGALSYVALVVFLRVSGKRTLSKMNAFDFVVTVALGSTLATVMLSQDAALAEGLIAFFVLVWGQLVVTWLSARSERFQSIVKAQPTLLYFRGRFLDDAIRKQRVTREEMAAALRSEGIGAWSEVEAVVLETEGSFSVLTTPEAAPADALAYVAGYDAPQRRVPPPSGGAS